MTKERDIEGYFVEQVRSLGGECLKWISPGTTGVPDRIVILPLGMAVEFVELKRPGKTVTEAMQMHWQHFIVGCHQRYSILCTKAGVDAWIASRAKELWAIKHG